MIPGVPYDAEIEWLQFSNQQYIDTGVFLSDKTNFEFWFSANSYRSTYFPLFGSYKNGSYLGCQRNSGGSPFYLNFWRGSSVKYSGNSNENNYTGIVKLNNGTFSFNGYTQFIQSDEFTSSITAWYGRINGVSSIFGADKKLGYLKIWDNHTLVRDLIPVRVGQVGYMYDRVSKRLFGNKGTGSFVLGPDVAKPVIGLWGMRKRKFMAEDYEQKGLIAQWDGIENAGIETHAAYLSNWVDLKGGTPCKIEKHVITDNGVKWGVYWRSSGVGGTFNRIFQWQNATFEVVSSEIGSGTSTRFLFQSGCSTTNEPSVAIAYTGGYIATLCYPTGTGTRYKDGETGMLGGTYAVVTGTDKSNFALYRNGAPAEQSGTGRWNIQRPWVACLTYRGTDQAQVVLAEVTVHAVRVYSRALSAAEIAHNYQIDKARFNL